MKIYLKYIATYYLVSARIRPKSKPIGVLWLEGYGIKLPPDSFAYLLLIPSVLTVFTGFSIEYLGDGNKYGINVINVSLFLLFMLIVDVFANKHLLNNKDSFFKVLPISNWTIVKLKILNEVLGVKSIIFISNLVIIFIFNLNSDNLKNMMCTRTLVFFLLIYCTYCLTIILLKVKFFNLTLEKNILSLIFRVFGLALFLLGYFYLKKSSISEINDKMIDFLDKYFWLIIFSSIAINSLLLLSAKQSLMAKK